MKKEACAFEEQHTIMQNIKTLKKLIAEYDEQLKRCHDEIMVIKNNELRALQEMDKLKDELFRSIGE